MLDVAKLASLQAVLAHGSFSGAAQALHLTQPAVSRQVSLLERQLGTMLVRRTRQGVQATEAGQTLLGHTEAILARLDRAEAEIHELAGLRRGTVRLGSFFTAAVHLSPELGAHLGLTHPGIVVVDDLVDRATAHQQLRHGALDLALVFEHDFEPATPASEGIEQHFLFDDPLRIVLPAGHRLAERATVSVADLAADTWIRAHEGSAVRRVDHVLTRAGIQPPLLLAGHGEEPFEIQALVAAGRGVTLTHDLTVVVNPAQLAIRPLEGEHGVRHVHAAVPGGRRPPATTAALEALHHIGAARQRRTRGSPEP